MKKKMNDSKKSKYIFIVLCIVCVALTVLTSVTDVNSTPLQYLIGYVITPIQKGLNEVGNWISDKGIYFQNNVDISAEYQALQEKVDQLTAENTALLADREEKERLEQQLELNSQYDYDQVGARIIARDDGNWFNVFTIDKGSNDGIQVDYNVISNGALVGIVTSVGPNYATVRSIIDDNSNVSAMVTSTEDTCIIAGDLYLIDEGKINLVNLTDSKDRVTVGDKVVTSDVSSRYLPGILIGYISEISMDSNNLTKSGYITPVVDFQHLREVVVIKELKSVEGAEEALNAEADTTEEAGTSQDSTSSGTESVETEEETNASVSETQTETSVSEDQTEAQ